MTFWKWKERAGCSRDEVYPVECAHCVLMSTTVLIQKVSSLSDSNVLVSRLIQYLN